MTFVLSYTMFGIPRTSRSTSVSGILINLSHDFFKLVSKIYVLELNESNADIHTVLHIYVSFFHE